MPKEKLMKELSRVEDHLFHLKKEYEPHRQKYLKYHETLDKLWANRPERQRDWDHLDRMKDSYNDLLLSFRQQGMKFSKEDIESVGKNQAKKHDIKEEDAKIIAECIIEGNYHQTRMESMTKPIGALETRRQRLWKELNIINEDINLPSEEELKKDLEKMKEIDEQLVEAEQRYKEAYDFMEEYNKEWKELKKDKELMDRFMDIVKKETGKREMVNGFEALGVLEKQKELDPKMQQLLHNFDVSISGTNWQDDRDDVVRELKGKKFNILEKHGLIPLKSIENSFGL